MTNDIVLCAVMACLVVWDLGRRFAARGRSIDPQELDQLADRLTVCEAEFKSIASLQDQLKLHAEKHNKVAVTVAAHGERLTKIDLRAVRK